MKSPYDRHRARRRRATRQIGLLPITIVQHRLRGSGVRRSSCALWTPVRGAPGVIRFSDRVGKVLCNGSWWWCVDGGVMSSEAEPVAAGRGSELEHLYRSDWPVLVRVAYLLIGSEAAAEEIAQDAFLRLQATSTEVRNPSAYLRTSVVNACRSYHRHRGVVQRTPMPRPEQASAEYDELFDAIARLTWRQQAALILRFHVDLTESEIAAVLGCRPSTVRSLTHRGLAALRKELS